MDVHVESDREGKDRIESPDENIKLHDMKPRPPIINVYPNTPEMPQAYPQEPSPRTAPVFR